eukprot:1156583-Pelagomonas_calceolata.AAC.1
MIRKEESAPARRLRASRKGFLTSKLARVCACAAHAKHREHRTTKCSWPVAPYKHWRAPGIATLASYSFKSTGQQNATSLPLFSVSNTMAPGSVT